VSSVRACVRVAAGTARPVITASYVPMDRRGNESGVSDSDSGDDGREKEASGVSRLSLTSVTSSSHLFPSLPIQAAAVGHEGGGGADSNSHILGKHELKGPSRLCLYM